MAKKRRREHNAPPGIHGGKISILSYIKLKDWLLVLASVILIVFQVHFDLKLPDYMKQVTALVQTGGAAMSAILSNGGKMMQCALASLILTICTGYLAARFAARFSYGLREGVYSKVMLFSNEEINRFSTASLITRSTNDITQIQMFAAMGLQVMIKAPITAITAIGKIQAKSWQWSALTACTIAFICLMLLFIMLYAIPRFKKMQWQTDNINRVTRENLTGLLVVRAYNAEGYQENKFEQANSDLTKTQRQAHIAMSVMNPGMNLAMNGLSLGIYWIGAILISNTAVSGLESIAQRGALFSEMVVFMQYAMHVVTSFLMLVMIFILLPRASVSIKRINEVLKTQSRIQNGTETAGKDGLRGELEFRNVSFRYPDAGEDVIHNISFTAHKGETVAIIGATGSGKSTIINLIPRLYDVTGGEILVDGRDVREYDQKALRDKIGFVPQKAYLFSGTVETNVGYGEDAPTAEVIRRTVCISQAKDFVETEEIGYDGAVAQTGSNFSGGQKQRLSIARAIAKDPEIMIFDDSFSALDYKTDRILRSALKSETAGTTNIIVAQRIGTIMDADRILVIDDGEIVGSGKHSELLQNCPVYREIAYSQLSKEELGA